jgi:hypothetical protein
MAKRKPIPDVLGGILSSGSPGQSSVSTETRSSARTRKTGDTGGAASTGDTAGEGLAGRYARTATGYRTAGGEERRRVSLYLTDAQRRRLKALAAEAGFDDVSGFVAERLGL